MENYAKAYTEVLEILKYFSKEELDKIPNEQIEFFEKNRDKDYEFKIEQPENWTECNISKKAYSILTVLASKYFLSEKGNEKLANKLKENRIEAEKIKRELYNPDNIFLKYSQDKDMLNMNQSQDESMIILEKKTFFQRIKEKIKKFFKKLGK